MTTAAVDDHTDVQVFGADAAKAIARASGGVPRLINVLAHKCLMLAYGENAHRVSAAHVRLAVADTPGIVAPRPWWRRMWRWPAQPPVNAPFSESELRTPARSKP